MRRRSSLVVAAVGLATSALMVTACSSGSSGSAAASSAPASAAPAASEAMASEAPAPSGSPAAAGDYAGQTLTVSNWAGYYPEDLAKQVQDKLGVPLTIANHEIGRAHV